MLSSLRKRFTWANVLLTLALVFAMTGGAYAAKKYLITSTKQISPSVLKALAGKKGHAGAQGPPGAQGLAGPAGKDGTNGAPGETGKEGKAGTNGKDGVSVTSKAFAGNKEPAGKPCNQQGGSELISSSGTTYACNGEKGADGQTGFTETLPAGKTETGIWGAAGADYPLLQEVDIPVSFAIPLSAGSEAAYLLTVEQIANKEGKGYEEGCTGTVEAPTAPPGVLCVYTAKEAQKGMVYAKTVVLVGNTNQVGYAPAGAVVPLAALKAESSFTFSGSFAVTAPTTP